MSATPNYVQPASLALMLTVSCALLVMGLVPQAGLLGASESRQGNMSLWESSANFAGEGAIEFAYSFIKKPGSNNVKLYREDRFGIYTDENNILLKIQYKWDRTL